MPNEFQWDPRWLAPSIAPSANMRPVDQETLIRLAAGSPPSCLCGHFESCEQCRPKADPPGLRLNLADYERTIPLNLEVSVGWYTDETPWPLPSCIVLGED